MKFESTLKPQGGISYASLGVVLLLAFFLYLLAAKTSEKPSTAIDDTKEKVQLQKRLAEQTAKHNTQIAEKPKPETSNLNREEKPLQKEEIKKGSKRELGFDLDFGSDPPRIIKSFFLPEAKNAGSGRVILKFRFSIRPDGSVAKVFPIMKGNPELELETMNMLRKWRFEKLSRTEDQIDQKVEISFHPQ